MHQYKYFDSYYSAKRFFEAAENKYNPNDYYVNLWQDDISGKWVVEIEQFMSYWKIDPCFEQ